MRVEGPTLLRNWHINTVTLVNARDFTDRRTHRLTESNYKRSLAPGIALNWDGDGEIPGFGCEEPINPGTPCFPGQ